ncbi:nuclear factor NF-kappa-B p110 subunit [Trichonephila clavata]|uniref:Nuclear factor NF-kappa-B p110 subunit n=1 Tax=Trichonephila clavata TaxID=2740835 RepID=A0A8X6L9M3_TRICU|nr:nuclear factor NF-kappa-B p110 subunit [Trichonephila clavata]
MPYRNHIKKEPKQTYAVLEKMQGCEFFSSQCGISAMMPEEFMEDDASNNEESEIYTNFGIIEENINPNRGRPYLSITVQPTDTFRYRYESEKGSHGGIKGENSSRGKKCYPEVKLENPPLNKRIKVKVNLYTNDVDPKPHVYELTGKNCRNGECFVDLNEYYVASFPSLAIQTRKKEEVQKTLLNRKMSEKGLRSSTKEVKASLEKEVQEDIKKINLDSAILCFQAFDHLNKPICEQVFSNPINNQKSAATGDLKIDRLSRVTGKCSGGDEVFLFCEKVKKENIKVHFYEKDDKNNIVWEADGKFSPADVHHQVAIAFRTPAYDKPINSDKVVHIELVRPSDGTSSDSLPFKYVPDDEPYENSRKRKRVDSDSVSSSLSPLCSICYSKIFNDESLKLDEILNKDLLAVGEIFEDAEENYLFDFGDLGDKFPSENWNITKFPSIGTSECFPDSASDLLVKMGSISLVEERKDKVEHNYPSKIEKNRQKLVDYADGIIKILKNREKSTYLYYGPKLFLIQDENGNSMLHLAILEQSENINLIQVMLEMISEEMVNKTNKFQETPLHLAVKGNHCKILFLLLVKGGDPNMLDHGGNNCLHLAAQKNHIQCMKMLLSKNEKLKKYKINQIDTLNHDGMSALHIAIANNSEDCVNYLLDAEADVNLHESKSGQSPLHLAAVHPNLMYKLLKQTKVDVQAKDFRGYTALNLVCINNGISFEEFPKDIENDTYKIIKNSAVAEAKFPFHSALSGPSWKFLPPFEGPA